MYKTLSIFFLNCVYVYATILIGVGGFDIKKYKKHYQFYDINTSHKMANISEVLSTEAKNVHAISMWVTKEWEESWYDADTVQKEIVDKGYIPVYVFYWFADNISIEYIQKNKELYFDMLKHFVRYLKKINGQKIVILNPEYNMSGVEKWEEMNDIFIQSFSIIRKDPQTLVGPCVGDFGNYKYINEPKEWALFDKSLYRAAKFSDFIAFQEMRALTRNRQKEILLTPERALHFSQYLYRKYHKPTMLAYLAISSYGKDGKKIQAEVYKKFLPILPSMKEKAKLFYFGNFHYYDYPGHVGYFKDAEECFGVVERNGSVKPSFKYFKQL